MQDIHGLTLDSGSDLRPCTFATKENIGQYDLWCPDRNADTGERNLSRVILYHNSNVDFGVYIQGGSAHPGFKDGELYQNINGAPISMQSNVDLSLKLPGGRSIEQVTFCFRCSAIPSPDRRLRATGRTPAPKLAELF